MGIVGVSAGHPAVELFPTLDFLECYDGVVTQNRPQFACGDVKSLGGSFACIPSGDGNCRFLGFEVLYFGFPAFAAFLLIGLLVLTTSFVYASIGFAFAGSVAGFSSL